MRISNTRTKAKSLFTDFGIGRLDFWLLPLLVCFLCLNLVDILSTLVAMNLPTFRELNPFAAGLFAMRFPGYLVALLLKFLPVAPMAYVVFLGLEKGEPRQIKALKLAVFIALVAADAYYTYVVANNLPQLLIAYLR